MTNAVFGRQDSDHILVELRDVGYIEVSGLEASASAAKAVHELLGRTVRTTKHTWLSANGPASHSNIIPPHKY